MPPDQLSPSPRGWTEASACLFLTCPGWFQGVAMSKSHCCSVFAAALLEVTTSHPRCRSSNTPSIALPQGLWKDSLPSGILFPPESCLLASLLPSFCCKYLFIIPFWATPYKIGPPTYPSTPAPLTAFFFPIAFIISWIIDLFLDHLLPPRKKKTTGTLCILFIANNKICT